MNVLYVEKDYILRLIHEMIRVIGKLLFGKDMDSGQDLPSDMKETYKKLIGMVDNGGINEAENVLCDNADSNDVQYFRMAVMFYEYLNQKTDQYLTDHDFSRAEILDGIRDIADLYGYGNLVETLMADPG